MKDERAAHFRKMGECFADGRGLEALEDAAANLEAEADAPTSEPPDMD
jgi:hypothetical protein